MGLVQPQYDGSVQLTRNGTLVVIKGEQSTIRGGTVVQTMTGARTSTLDSKTNRVINDDGERNRAAPLPRLTRRQTREAEVFAGTGRPGSFSIIVVGK